MITIYQFLILSLLIVPFVGLYASRKATANLTKPVVLFFLFHNICFYSGYSLRGDTIDCVLFFIEYLVVCFFIFWLFRINTIHADTARFLEIFAFASFFLIGLAGAFFLMVGSQDMIPDHIFHFTANNNTYETRRYRSGFASLADTRYTFDTYRTFNFLPIEHKIDQTDFFDTKTTLDIDEKGLIIQIQKGEGGDQILFSSTNGNSFSKLLR